MTEYTCIAWNENGRTEHVYVPTKALPGSSAQPDDLARVTAELEQMKADWSRAIESARAEERARAMSDIAVLAGASDLESPDDAVDRVVRERDEARAERDILWRELEDRRTEPEPDTQRMCCTCRHQNHEPAPLPTRCRECLNARVNWEPKP